jgi:hypothetical protein
MGEHPTLSAPIPMGQREIGALIEDVRNIYCAAGTMLMVSVGKVIVERTYGGDISLWHSRGRTDQLAGVRAGVREAITSQRRSQFTHSHRRNGPWTSRFFEHYPDHFGTAAAPRLVSHTPE